MPKTLTYEQMMALFAEGRKETAELRKELRAGNAELRASIADLRDELRTGNAELRDELRASALKAEKETAELRTELRAGALKAEKETAELRASIAGQQASISRLEIVVEKNNAMMEKNNAELRASIAGQQASISRLEIVVERNNAMMEENNRKVDILTNQFGILTNKLGEIVEKIAVPGIVDKFNEKGFGFNSVSTNVKFQNEAGGGNLTEVDALLEDGKSAVIVETKTELKVSDVNKHVKRLNALREQPRFKGKKIYGALATSVSRKKPVDYALEQGFYVLQRPDALGLQILDFPKGRRAKAW